MAPLSSSSRFMLNTPPSVSSSLRKPIHNPYDKFSQPDFDAWIGGITGALRKALGHDAGPSVTQRDEEAPVAGGSQSGYEVRAEESEDRDFEVESGVEDSFAELKARRAKGKARDPREGPGLGSEVQPISILSDSDDSEADSGSEEEEREELGSDSENERSPIAEYADDEEISISVEDQEAEDVDEPLTGPRRGATPDEPIELLDDEEDAVLHYSDDSDTKEDGEAVYDDDEYDPDEADAEEDGQEDEYELDEPDDAAEVLLDVEESQKAVYVAEDNNTTEPLPLSMSMRARSQPIEIPDPWQGPQIYAEDFYSGGDFAEGTVDASNASPSRLTPQFDDVEANPITESAQPYEEEDQTDNQDAVEEGYEEVAEEAAPEVVVQDIWNPPIPSAPAFNSQEQIAQNAMLDDLYGDMDFETIVEDESLRDGVQYDFSELAQQPNWQSASLLSESSSTTPAEPPANQPQEVSEEVTSLQSSSSTAPPQEDAEVAQVDVSAPQDTEGSSEELDFGILSDSYPIALAGEQEMADMLSSFKDDNAEIFMAGLMQPQGYEEAVTYDDIFTNPTDGLPLADTTSADDGLEVLSVSSRGEHEFPQYFVEEPLSGTAFVDVTTQPEAEGPTDEHDTEAEPHFRVADSPPPVNLEVEVITADHDAGTVRENEGPEKKDISSTQETKAANRHNLQPGILESDNVTVPRDDNQVLDASNQAGELTQLEEQNDAPADDTQGGQDIVEPGAVTSGDSSTDSINPSPSDMAVEVSQLAADDDHLKETQQTPEPDASITPSSPMPVVSPSHKAEDTAKVTAEPSPIAISSPPTRGLERSIPKPISADPSVPDPTSLVPSPTRRPLILSMPGTPNFLLSPAGTPGSGRPTPVSVPVPAGILKALQMQQSLSSRGNTSGLFTPVPGSMPTTPSKKQEENAEIVDEEGSGKGGSSAMEEDSARTEGRTEVQVSGESERSISEPAKAVEEEDRPPTPGHEQTDVPAAQEPVTEREVLEVSPSTSTSTTMQADSLVTLVADPLQIKTLNAIPRLPHRVPSVVYPSRMIMTRTPTDPVLFADPYPYSLSTPTEYVEAIEQPLVEIENDYSGSSPSSADRESDDKDSITPVNDLHVVANTDSIKEGSRQPSEAIIDGDVNTGSYVDLDADGDEDPDYPVSESKLKSSQPTVQPEEDPFLLMGSDTIAAPSAVDNDVAFSDEKVVPGLVEEDDDKPVIPPATADLPVEIASAGTAEAATEALPPPPPSTPIATLNPKHGEPSPAPSALPLRVSKRKRESAPQLPHILTKSLSTGSTVVTEQNEEGRAKPVKAKSKSKSKSKKKQKLSSQATDDNVSVASSASIAARMLHPGSNASSRASSVVSSAPSQISSILMQPSPTGRRDNGKIAESSVAARPPLFHAHTTIPRHHHGLPMTIQQQMQRQQTLQSLPRSNTPVSSSSQSDPSPPAPTQSTPSQSASSRSALSQGNSSHRTITASNSPVTRSHCRYHKISLPVEEGGPRVCFLVPGCTLGNKELMEEEEIEDHGIASHDDGIRCDRTDIDSLDFANPDLIGVLRQLVGVDLLREQEAWYLPPPGEDYVPKARRKSSTATRTGALVESGVGDLPTSPRTSTSLRSPVVTRSPATFTQKAPVSTAASTATSVGSRVHKLRDSDKDSLSTVAFSDTEPSGPSNKRARLSPPSADQAADPETPAASQPSRSSRPHKPRRSRRLDKDVMAYTPEHESEKAEEDTQKVARSHKKSAKRSRKRARSTDAGGVDEGEGLSKKTKTYASLPDPPK